MSDILSSLHWRYATKKFNPTKILATDQLDRLLEAVRLAPSSFGLQPYKVIVVSNPAVRSQLSAAAWGQPQVTQASHLLLFAAKTNINNDMVDEFIQMVATTRGLTLDQLAPLNDMMKGVVASKTPAQLIEWAARQAYIALGVLLAAAAVEQIDASPMEGFDPKQFDTILELDKLNLTTAVIAGVGFRAEDDPTTALAKVRFSRQDMVLEV